MSKKLTWMIAVLAGLLGFGIEAAQDTSITQAEVRNPRTLETWLEANATDAETRLTALGSTASSTMVLTNSANAGACSITFNADKNDNAGDKVALSVADGGTLSYQSDITSQGTLATKLSIGNTGIVTMKGGATLDNSTDEAVLTLTETTVAVAGAFDANSVTVDAAQGITVQSAGALKIAAATATSVDYGSASVTAHTFTSDGTGTSEVVLPAGSIDSTEILDGTIAAGDIGDSELAALASVSSAANAIPYFTGAGTASTVGSSANVLTFLAAANNAAMADIIGGAFTEGDIANSTILTADIKDGEIVNADLSASAAVVYSKLSVSNSIHWYDLIVVDTPTDEDFLTYEATTGDWEFHSIADKAGGIAAAITEGQLADSIVVSADIKNDSIVNEDINTAAAIAYSKLSVSNSIRWFDLKPVDSPTDEDVLTYESTTGDWEFHSADEIAGKFTEGALANSIIVTADIKDGEIVNADISASAGIVSTKLATSGDGAVDAAYASVSETVGMIHSTVITFTNVVLVVTDGAGDKGSGVKVYDFPAGAVTVLGAVFNGTATVSAGATNTSVMAMGTAAAANDNALTSTEADVIPSVSCAAAGTNAVDTVLAAAIVLDGTATAKDLYINWAIDDDNMNADTTNTVTGTVSIYWINSGDNQ